MQDDYIPGDPDARPEDRADTPFAHIDLAGHLQGGYKSLYIGGPWVVSDYPIDSPGWRNADESFMTRLREYLTERLVRRPRGAFKAARDVLQGEHDLEGYYG